jgi:hypothetical protein
MFNQADQLSFANKKKWSAIPRIARTVPFGYVVDDNDPDLLQPVVSELEALEQAKIHLKQFSYREVAPWLSNVTGRYISHMGLKKRVDNDNRRRQAGTTLKRWSKWAEEKRSKAETILARIGEAEARDVEDIEQLSFDFGERRAS